MPKSPKNKALAAKIRETQIALYDTVARARELTLELERLTQQRFDEDGPPRQLDS